MSLKTYEFLHLHPIPALYCVPPNFMNISEKSNYCTLLWPLHFPIFFCRPLLLNRPPPTIRNTRVRLLEIYSCLFMSEIKDILEKCNYSPPILYFYIYQKSIRKVRSLVFTLKISLKIHMVKLYYVFCILYNFHWLGI